MNENLNLVEILKNCPEGTKLYSTVFGEVELDEVDNFSLERPIVVSHSGGFATFTNDGRLFYRCDGECVLFPSKDQRDWSKFNYKKPKFDPKTLQPFDKVLVQDLIGDKWRCDIFSYIDDDDDKYPYVCVRSKFKRCIPYNDDTKHLLGTTKEAPEFYRYWED